MNIGIDLAIGFLVLLIGYFVYLLVLMDKLREEKRWDCEKTIKEESIREEDREKEGELRWELMNCL